MTMHYTITQSLLLKNILKLLMIFLYRFNGTINFIHIKIKKMNQLMNQFSYLDIQIMTRLSNTLVKGKK
jgi:hypothetical protein